MHTRTAGPSLELGEGLAPALPSIDDVRSVAGVVRRQIGAWFTDPYALDATRWGDAGMAYELEISPGALRLAGRELHPLQDVAHDAVPVERDELTLWDDLEELPEVALATRGTITEWSKRSRARMAYAIAGLDLSAWSDEGRRMLVMVTLTLPGEWESIAGTGADFKAIMRRFRARWEYELGPMRGIWKLEFHDRGAPHLHILTTVPPRIRGRQAYRWIARQWVAACDHQDVEQRARQLRAHDFSSEKRPNGCVDVVDQWSDQKKMAVYFNKHSAKTRDAKEYQHAVPTAWQRPGAGPGRFWGIWGLKPARARVCLSTRDAARARRIMVKIAQGRNADAQLRQLRAVGIPLSRARITRLRQSRRLTGMWILVNDGLEVSLQLARALSLERT